VGNFCFCRLTIWAAFSCPFAATAQINHWGVEELWGRAEIYSELGLMPLVTVV
jgi:hypothetical protein